MRKTSSIKKQSFTFNDFCQQTLFKKKIKIYNKDLK